MRQLPLVGLLFLLPACGPVPPPKPPTPTPPPVTPTPVCELGQHHSCYHNPAGTWFYACPVYDLTTGGVVGVNNVATKEQCVIPTIPEKRVCPMWPLPAGAQVYLGAKPYGQGVDSSVRVRGSREWCAAAGHANASQDCHLEGWEPRLDCELKLLGNKCQIWQYSQDGGSTWKPCLQEAPDGAMSCDHFGDVRFRDDPNTAPFEGQPAVCGLQRDERGDPMAGIFIIAHGKGKVRACLPDGTGCSGPVDVDW